MKINKNFKQIGQSALTAYNYNTPLKATRIASAITFILASFHVHAVVTTVTSTNGQEITLTPGEEHVVNGIVLSAINGGAITGDNVSLTSRHIDSRYNMLYADNGGQIKLSNSTITHINPNNLGASADHVSAIKGTGEGTFIDISDSTIEGFHRILEVSNGAKAKLTNITVNANNYGLQTIGNTSSLEMINTHVSLLEQGMSINSRNGSLLIMTDSSVRGNNYAVALSWDNLNIERTNASVGIFDNVEIETFRNQNTGYGLWLIDRSQALMKNSHIIINGSSTSGIFATKSQELSELHNTTIELRNSDVKGVSMQQGSQILLADRTKILGAGDNNTGLYAHHNNGIVNSTAATKIITDNAEIILDGNTSYGAVAQSDGSEIYLNNTNLTMNGNNSIGMLAKTSGTTLHTNGVNAQIHGASSAGMQVHSGADAQIDNSWFNMTGTASHGISFRTQTTAESNSMHITGSRIETQDGYAIRNESGSLDLTLTDSTIIGRTNGETDVAIGIFDTTLANRSGQVNITAEGSHIFGDIVSSSNNPNRSLNITLNNGSTFTGNLAFADSLTLGNSSQWNVLSNSTLATLVNNNGGLISFASPDNGTFKTITVNGDYTGGGTLELNTVLDGDSSSTDRLIINGNTSGSTGVIVNNFGGGGEQTTNGIEVISVSGQSDGIFSLKRRAVAGAYEYFLHQDSGNWYLSSQLAPIVMPGEPGIYRPEAGGYITNISAANRIFNLSLADREGRAEDSSLWLRQVGSRNTSHDTSGQLRMAANSYVIQGGGELLQVRFGDNDRLGVGIMASHGRTKGDTRSKTSLYRTKSILEGYSAGLYGTWYQNADNLEGTYVDSWVQYSWFDAEVSGKDLVTERYYIDGFSASIETGYRMFLQQNLQGNLFVTPQAQLTWNDARTDTHVENNGTRVESKGAENLQTRLGVKLSVDSVEEAESDELFTVYGEFNWLYNSKSAGVIMDGVRVNQAGNRHLAELKLGFEGQLNNSFDVWTNIKQQIGDRSYSNTTATLGLKYRF
ncbi:autotransporter family protein [Zophobihabitans entericus]|uniref:Autotransporter outer membrane beta-barrel domain-containing protein n=1 Tax=Zophobihabitans entericus TaxID=1635327 RepID=A0A6G9ICU2_9GAMM|nr:autotransporter outer membrane beta-barrel domain-containing protein [Zophobihabitans entericus]QIQ21400.1 autotransporter outer membrane beta-barrel domain-containing protein [Zophobihabitans entericus]